MIALARTVHSDTPDHDPASLLDAQRFGSAEELEEHLLDSFLPTVYRRRPRPGAPDWDPDRAQRWLGHLAHHLTELKTPDLAWWRLGDGPRDSTRTLVTALVTALAIGLVDGIVLTLVFGGGAGLAFSLLGLLETPLDVVSAVSPRSVLKTDRRAVVTQLALAVPVFGAAVGLGLGVVVDLLQGHLGRLVLSPTASLAVGAVSGLGGALGYTLSLTAWGQWCVLSRVWLPLTGRLPWAVAAFLDDAYQRGVLRQAGAVYQFRHARLQSHLARAHRRR